VRGVSPPGSSRGWPRPSARSAPGGSCSIGAGWNRTEFEAFGIPFDQRASRFEEAFDDPAAARRERDRARTVPRAEDAVLLPPPARRVPLMIGSNGDRLLRVALPHVDAWTTWYDDYGNTPDGFASLNERVSALAREVGRDPAEVTRSACALVVLVPDAGERPIPEHVPPIEGSSAAIADRLRALADAGADETILVVSPITEASIRSLGDAIAELA
jgi:alkanesulfonate monooxygenase SsuD/methylene tetrahydromethanopterin reductase-like flavin-dependent oxidoreductase (luciferase family)